MSSRGAVIKNGHITTSEYTVKYEIDDMKILVGIGNNHGLPDFAHTPNSIYVKENKDGSLREMRFYNNECALGFEIGYHAEPNITGNRHEKVLHYHEIDENLNRTPAEKMPKSLKDKYRKYLEVYGLYD